MADTIQQRKLNHLYWRAGFGPGYKMTSYSHPNTTTAEVNRLLEESKVIKPIIIFENESTDIRKLREMDKEEKKMMAREAKTKVFDFAYQWASRMVNDEQTLREKMTLFWSGHFACRVTFPRMAEKFNNTVRQYALGNFGDLLLAISKEPAMLLYLNNQQNSKAHPNENFAREVLELFTLGRGNYSETDIREAARAFTGWRFDRSMSFQFAQGRHDFGSKTFLGKTGNFDGDEILKIVLEQKQCARFITTRIYKFFVNDDPDKDIIEKLAEAFYNSNYDIGQLMKSIFNSTWFYDEKNIGVKIKSPIELLVGLMKNFHITFENELVFIRLQRTMGQEFFHPPNVEGWPGGKRWIDHPTLLYRMALSKKLLRGATINLNSKEEFDAQAPTADMNTRLKNMQTQAMPQSDMNGFIKAFSSNNDQEPTSALTSFLLQTPADRINRSLIETIAPGQSRSDRIKEIILNILSLPEYQMC